MGTHDSHSEPTRTDSAGSAHTAAMPEDGGAYETTAPADRRRRSRRHPADVLSLVMGLIFLVAAGLWAALITDVLSYDMLPLLLPIALIGVGAVGLLASLLGRSAE